MTTVTHDAAGTPGGGGAGKGKLSARLKSAPGKGPGKGPGPAAVNDAKNQWKRLWQVPLLVGGVALFAWGVKAFVGIIRPVPFEVQTQGVRSLLAAENYAKAIEQINILANYYKDPRQQAALEELAGDASYLAQKKQPAFVRENYQAVLDHYALANAAGIVAGVEMNERWGESALALGDAKMAIAKWEAAIEAAGDADGPEVLRTHARELVNAYVAGGELAKAQQVLEKLLAGAEAVEQDAAGRSEAVDNQSWAICKQIEIGLTVGDGAALRQRIDQAGRLLETIPERNPAARILTWMGRAELDLADVSAAEKDLAAARETFIGRTVDDGRAALLLAKIAEARGDFTKAAVLYQDVVTEQAGTSLWAAARFGRAEMRVRSDGAKNSEFRIRNSEPKPSAASEEKWPQVDGENPPEKISAPRMVDTIAPSAGLDDAILTDYRFTLQAIRDAEDGEAIPPELIGRDIAHAALVADYTRASDSAQLSEALSFLALLQELGPAPSGAAANPAALAAESEAMAFRLGSTKERRGNEMLIAAEEITSLADRAPIEAAARAMLADAAGDFLRHAKLTTLQDAVSGNSLWNAGLLYDRAGQAMRSVDVFEQFTIQRPRDPRVPEGLLAMGRLYQSAGMIEKAIPIYQRNIRENPKTAGAYASALGLARCYMALADAAQEPPPATAPATTAPSATAPAAIATATTAPASALIVAATNAASITRADALEKAETALLSLVQNNSDLLPTSNEFRQALFALGDLYYRDGRWADAILRLEEAVTRYPRDAGNDRAKFMLAESYRRSAVEIGQALSGAAALSGGMSRDALVSARRERLLTAAGIFSRVIEALDPQASAASAEGVAAEAGGGAAKKLTPLEEQYLRTSYLNRAQCYFDRGAGLPGSGGTGAEDLAAAIKLYDEAATRFSDEALAARAYVQIVNAYVALKQPTQADAAAERGRWVLKRIPDSAFASTAGDGLELSRADYDKLLTVR